MKYYLYMTWLGSDFIINYTHHPALDFLYLRTKGYEDFRLLTPPAPLAVAHYLWKQVGGSRRNGPEVDNGFSASLDPGGEAGSGINAGWRRWVNLLRSSGKEKTRAEMAVEKQAAVKKLLHQMGLAGVTKGVGAGTQAETAVLLAGNNGALQLPSAADLENVLRLVAGRLLFAEEVTRAAAEQNIIIAHELADILQVLALQNRLSIVPSVEITRPGEWRCRRCGQTETVKAASCPVCGQAWCPYCEGCVNMGEARGCRPVYAAPPGLSASGPAPGDFKLRFELTSPQEAAARQLEEFIIADPRNEALVWAVCGAGKTEIAFPAIRTILNRGGRVLLAIPRRDVVLELAPRIREAFPLARLAVLYGGCVQKFGPADITVATTHQALRYNGCFDLVILDEADAYPYHGSAMLRLAVERAGKPGGKRVFMTATPDTRLYADAGAGRKRLITIPARYHRFPLPEPDIIREPVFIRKSGGKEINPFITNWLAEKYRQTGGQVFIFVPTVKLCQETGAALQQALLHLFPSARAHVLQYSHAADPERDRKRVSFKQGEFPFLLSTTIMERGITVANAHVLVLFADFVKVFDEGALIQMAGRAGRSATFPGDEVLFIGEKITPAIDGACKKISLLNREAAAQGYLRCDDATTIS